MLRRLSRVLVLTTFASTFASGCGEPDDVDDGFGITTMGTGVGDAGDGDGDAGDGDGDGDAGDGDGDGEETTGDGDGDGDTSGDGDGDGDTGSGGMDGPTGEYDYQPTNARIYAPPNVHDGGPHAVVFGFHGAGDSKQNFMYVMLNGGSWKSLSSSEGIIFVTMQGTAGGQSIWTYPIAVQGWPLTVGTGDVERVLDTLDYLEDSYDVDSSRIYAVGFSMGSTMSTEVALYLDDVFAAFMSTAQGTPVSSYSALAPKSGYKVPGLFQGDPQDQIYSSVPYTANMLQSNGHTVEVKEFPGTGHVGSWMKSTIYDPGPQTVWNWLSQYQHP